MANTLRSLAGNEIFKAEDVITALQAPLDPEKQILDRYVFLPHVRSGIAAALDTPFNWALPVRASVNVRVPVIDDRGGLDAEMTVHVFGPSDVTEIAAQQVIRTYPKADAENAEVDDLAHVEFDRPDLPWLFTPAGPDAQGHLVPWITLVVAEARFLDWGERRGTARTARIRRDQLQPLGDAWAWAHAQVTGGKGATADSPPTLEQRLSESNAAHNLSRLVCPRRLASHTNYVACVVPTFLAGAQSALGLTSVSTLIPAWGTTENFAGGDPLDPVRLPVLFSWEFATGEEGNFESLARKLLPAIAPRGVGRRRVDTTRPWIGQALGVDDAGAEMVVEGPVVSPQSDVDDQSAEWPSEAEQHWDAAVTNELISKLNEPDEQAHLPDPGPPIVGPPLYGGMHLRQPRIETDAVAAAAQPPVFRELNLDPRRRMVAGLGTRVVQAEQEDLMLAAWNQVMGVDAANRTLRLAQLAKHVGASLHRRHLSKFADAAVIATTERVHAKIIDVGKRTVSASIDASSLPLSVTTGAFRRLARVRGPVSCASGASFAQRAHFVDSLTVVDDRLTRDWVMATSTPDGIRGLSAAAAARITDAVAARVAPGMTATKLLGQWREQLLKPAAIDRLTPDMFDRAQLPDVIDLGAPFATALIRRLLQTGPTDTDIRLSPTVGLTAASHAKLLQTVLEGVRNAGAFEIAQADAKRLGLQFRGQGESALRVQVATEALRALAARWLDLARATNTDLPLKELERTAAQLRGVLARSSQLQGSQVIRALATLAAKGTIEDRFADPARGRIRAPALQLVEKLDPARTIPTRIAARLTSGSGRLPSWVRPGWFDDQRTEPVMAHPRFRYPMYEPLYRYDREWMVPGLGLIKRPDMATLLATNNRFIEAYLVGLNHEMARELLWREFPTDQRGTYFSSFWTGESELVADLHEPAWRTGPFGSHVDPGLDGQLVFLARGDLIRRYPGVVAHAALEVGSDRGIPIFAADSPARTLFHALLPPNVLLVGFSLTVQNVRAPGRTWWFTLSENPTEPRFGLDPSRAGPISRDNLVWTDFDVNRPGGFLDATRHTTLSFDGVTWGSSSATNASLLFQLPARAAFRATKMVDGALG
jgi:hypothetical protein